MGTTTKGIPYPESTAFVKDGAGAMQDLAESVDGLLGGSRGRANRATAGTASVPDSTVHDLNTPDLVASDSTAEWSIDAGALLYTGPDAIAVVTGQVTFAGSGAGYRRLYLRKNGTAQVKTQLDPDGTDPDTIAVTQIIDLVSGDDLSLAVKQTSGGALNATAADLRAVVVTLA